jgi:alpha-glucoside transport system substrate-binding protein
MAIFDRQKQREVDQIVEDYTQHGLSRREFMQRAVALGLTFSAAGALLAACGGGGTSTPGTVDALVVWGDTELANFKAVLEPFTSRTGIKVNVESTRDLDAVLTTRIRGNNPPDIANLPNPGQMQQLAGQHKLIALDKYLDKSKLSADYAQAYLDVGSYQGSLYALFYKLANKGTIWYNPSQFQSNSYTIPDTWDAMIALSDQIAASGKYPWSMGVESGSASGWPSTDWIAEILLNESGPDVYDQLVAHKIKWTDAPVKSAFQKFNQIASGKHYINGAPQSILATNFQPASFLPFNSPPDAYMYYLGDFTEGFITAQFKSAKPGTDFNFFPFPSINPQFKGGVTFGADLLVALKDNDAVKQLVQYLATADAQTIWVKKGGFTTPNKSVDPSAYPDPIAKASAQALTSASTARYGAGDLLPPAVQQAWWKGMLTYIGDPTQLDSVLGDIEAAAQQASQQ